MDASSTASPLDRLRARLDALPLDRAPLRRAGVLAVLLIALLAGGRLLTPDAPTAAERHDVRAATEEDSAPRSASLWTGGRVLALLFLASGGGLAWWLHRRSGTSVAAHGSTMEVLETHPLGPGQSLRLVACGREVLLLSVATEGTALLRHWPRDAFEAAPASFADALAEMSTAPLDAAPLDATSLKAPTPAPPVPRGTSPRRPAPTSPLEASTRSDALPPLAEPPRLEITEERADAAPGIEAHARGALFPRAPRQFDVRRG